MITLSINKLKFPSLDKSLNNKEQIFTGWNAVEAAVYCLISTPMNSIPEMPTLGFDLDDFLWRSRDDKELSELETELADKIRQVTNDSNINCVVEVDQYNTYITIIYQKDNGSEVKLPITISDGTGGRSIKFKDIIVR